MAILCSQQPLLNRVELKRRSTHCREKTSACCHRPWVFKLITSSYILDSNMGKLSAKKNNMHQCKCCDLHKYSPPLDFFLVLQSDTWLLLWLNPSLYPVTDFQWMTSYCQCLSLIIIFTLLIMDLMVRWLMDNVWDFLLPKPWQIPELRFNIPELELVLTALWSSLSVFEKRYNNTQVNSFRGFTRLEMNIMPSPLYIYGIFCAVSWRVKLMQSNMLYLGVIWLEIIMRCWLRKKCRVVTLSVVQELTEDSQLSVGLNHSMPVLSDALVHPWVIRCQVFKVRLMLAKLLKQIHNHYMTILISELGKPLEKDSTVRKFYS